MHKYEKLNVFQKAMDFVEEIYKFSKNLPEDEKFGLVSQIRRAAVSIPLNIAEGSGSSTNKGFKNFLEIALKSTYEVKTTLQICQRLKYGVNEFANDLIQKSEDISRMLIGLMQSLSKK